MTKLNVLQKVFDEGIVAIVRAEDSHTAIKICDACLKGGINIIEVTFTVPFADQVIKDIVLNNKNEKLLIGAGTVLDSETARIAILAGAKFIVSPSFNEDTAKLCHRYQIPYMPGCMTLTEMVNALEHGVDIIKLFPGSAFGPSYVKSIKAPLPQLNIMPTGGVNLDNIQEWFNNGVCSVGVGGDLFQSAKTGDFETIAKKASLYVEAIKQIKQKQ